MRSVNRMLGTVGLVVSMTFLGVSGAAADDGAITDQPFADFYGLEKGHAKGMDGSGVTIAMLDGWVDTSVPELAGATIESREKCEVQKSPDDTTHATAVASVLVSKNYGWAPNATLISYPIAFEDTRSDPCRWKTWDAIHDALSTGVDIITIQVTSKEGADFAERLAVLRAARMNVPVVWGAGNNGNTIATSGMEANGAIAVGSHTLEGTPSEWATFGQGLTITAVGEELTARTPDEAGNLTRIVGGWKGTSLSAPMVAGALALGAQKWPNATGNQLTRALLETAIPCTSKGISQKCGYGAMNVGVFIQHPDPTKLDDSNPLLQKQPSYTNRDHQMLRDYDDGVWDHEDLLYDTSYTYRGTKILIKDGHPTHTGQYGSSPRYMKRIEHTEHTNGLHSKTH